MRNRQVYTLRPLSRQEWAALGAGPAGWYRGRLDFPDGGKPVYLEAHPTREEAEAEIAEVTAEFAAMRERYPGLPARVSVPSGSEIMRITG